MKNTLRLLIALVLMVGLSQVSFGQAVPTTTTLSSAMAGGAANNLAVLTSVTGITASGTGTSVATQTGGQTFLLIDHELMLIRTVNTTSKVVTVIRANGGNAVAHNSGVTVVYGAGGSFDPKTGVTSGLFVNTQGGTPSGQCSRSANQFLPVYSQVAQTVGKMYDCLGGQWYEQVLPEASIVALRFCTVPVGSVAYSSQGVVTSAATGTWYDATVFVPDTQLFTGISLLGGTTSQVDAFIVGLFENATTGGAGSVLAQSLGTVMAATNAFQDIPFTATKIVTGPMRYVIATQANGTTGSSQLRLITSSTYVDYLASQQAGTWNVIPSITMGTSPSSAAHGPIACLY